MNTRLELETATIWADSWPTVAADVAKAEPWELDDAAQAVPVLVTSDTETAARLLWSPGQTAT